MMASTYKTRINTILKGKEVDVMKLRELRSKVGRDIEKARAIISKTKSWDMTMRQEREIEHLEEVARMLATEIQSN